MFDDAPVRLPYNTGLERSLLTVLAVFGDQLSRFLGEFYPTSAFDHGVAGCLCAFAGRGDGLYGFGFECFGIEAFILEPEIYGTGVAEEDDALFVLDDGDAFRVVWIVVPGAGIGITVSAFEWDEFVGIVVDHGYFLQIHLVAVYDWQTRRCAWEWRGTGMKAVGKWSVFDLGIARVKGLEDLVEQSFGLRLELFQAVLMLAAGCGSVHGVHKTKALQGALPSFDWCVYGKLVGVLLQCLLNGVKLLGDSCGWAKHGRQMHARGGLLKLAAYLLFADKLRHLLHVFRIGRNVDRRFDGIGRRRCDDPLQKPTFARHRLPLSTRNSSRNSVVQKRRVLVDLYMPMRLGKRKRPWN